MIDEIEKQLKLTNAMVEPSRATLYRCVGEQRQSRAVLPDTSRRARCNRAITCV